MTPLRLIRGTIVASLASKFATCLFYDRVFISFIVARSFDVRRGSEASVTSIRRCKVGLMCHLLAITRNKSFRSEPLHRDPLWHLDNDHSRFRATMVMHFSSIFHVFSFSLLFLFFSNSLYPSRKYFTPGRDRSTKYDSSSNWSWLRTSRDNRFPAETKDFPVVLMLGIIF